MRRNHRRFFIVFALVLSGCGGSDDPGTGGWELKPPAAEATPVAAERQLAGTYPVGSRIKDRDAGGFGPCDNYPFALGGKNWGTEGAVALVAFPAESVAYFKHRGIAVRLVNRSGETVSFKACDSCLFLVQEAQDEQGRWRAIEYAPEAICGNSYHRVSIRANRYWQFPARVYDGPHKTKLRFRLDRQGEEPLYSNEFDGSINVAQFEVPRPPREPG